MSTGVVSGVTRTYAYNYGQPGVTIATDSSACYRQCTSITTLGSTWPCLFANWYSYSQSSSATYSYAYSNCWVGYGTISYSYSFTRDALSAYGYTAADVFATYDYKAFVPVNTAALTTTSSAAAQVQTYTLPASTITVTVTQSTIYATITQTATQTLQVSSSSRSSSRSTSSSALATSTNLPSACPGDDGKTVVDAAGVSYYIRCDNNMDTNIYSSQPGTYQSCFAYCDADAGCQGFVWLDGYCTRQHYTGTIVYYPNNAGKIAAVRIM